MSSPDSRSIPAGPFLRKNLALWNVTNYKVTDVPHWQASFTIPGLSHESFDVDANAKITSLMITSVLARGYALHKPDSVTGAPFLDWPALTNGKYTFVSSTEFRISQDLYNPEIPKWPLDAKFSLGNVGNSSVANVIEFFAHGDEKTHLWSNVTQLVYIDSATRKPTPLPDWFRDKYKGKGCLDKGFIVKAFERPSVTYCNPVKVAWSDTDNYKHTNFASYVRYALDCLHAALRIETDVNPDECIKTESPLPNGVPDSADLSSSNLIENQAATSIGLEGSKVSSDSTNENGLPNGDISPIVLTNGNLVSGRVGKPLQGITKEKVANGLKHVQICYLSESLEGQNLNAHVWQQPGQESVVWCAIERDSRDICQIKLEYFNSPRQSGYNL